MSLNRPIPIKPGDAERLAARLVRNPETGCLLWTGSRNSLGYGMMGMGSRTDGTKSNFLVHRVAWVLAHGEIPAETPCVLHDCPGGDNPACCNVEHLWLGTNDDNQEDKSKKLRGCYSKMGRAFGAALTRKGRWQSQAMIHGKMQHFGVFDEWQIASALALFEKNKSYRENHR